MPQVNNDGEHVNTVSSVIAYVMSKVNSPMREPLPLERMVAALKAPDMGIWQLHIFFYEIPVKFQRLFASAHGLTADELYRAAQVYGEAMNRAVPLVSGLPAAWDRKPGPPPGPPEVTLPPSEPLDGPVRSLLDMPGARRIRAGNSMRAGPRAP